MLFITFEILFGWRKASKCKKLIRHVQCRLKLLKNRRESIINQSRQDIVQLIKNGEDYEAFRRVEQLIIDQNTKDVYDILDNFGELIIIELPYIRKHRDCPNDISEAVSSLSFASARLGNLPELIKLRKLFGKRYGAKFVNAAVELVSGNQVDQQMIEKLEMKSVSDDVKFKLLKEIARESNLQLSPPNIGGRLDLQYEKVHSLSCGTGEIKWKEQVSTDDSMQQNARSYGFLTNDVETIPSGALAIVKSGSYDIEPLGRDAGQKSLVRVGEQEESNPSGGMHPYGSYDQTKSEICSFRRPYDALLLQNDKNVTGLATFGSPVYPAVRSNEYVDDVSELQPCITDALGGDLRGFAFELATASIRFNCETSPHSSPTSAIVSQDEENTNDGETLDQITRSRIATNNNKKARNYVSLGHQGCRTSLSQTSSMDTEYAVYYGEARDSSPDEDLMVTHRTHHRRKHREKMSLEKDLFAALSCSKKNLHKRRVSDQRVSCGSPFKERRVREDIRNSRPINDVTDNKGMDEMDISECPVSFMSSSRYSSTAMVPYAPTTGELSSPNCMALTISNGSSGSSYCSHVHPKLPDYDSVVSKFIALKIETKQIIISEISTASALCRNNGYSVI